ncbi:alanine racemase [Desulfurivibrio alkaliphilus]|uniref:Alanine racemase n=1 Tax=Desulfurivibrio alkaliphilus (strain DSM 19089 / UNIQEM U267 / AHT2) TaxID=589865 RepID=D6Z484_DESAT|nr:alanine racemase [Desulfurivibrio alkaliphilus]ADH86359.1 alanine racemase [Desulfurivibrio alkaliphilus AHT 2]
MIGAASYNAVEIDLKALRVNYEAVRSRVAPGIRIMAVVKADAYGHGLEAAAGAFAGAGADCFGVGTLEEGIRLRRAGLDGEVVLLLGFDPREAAEVVEYRLSPVVFAADGLEALSRLAADRGRQVGVHLKLDAGMGRFGVAPADLTRLAAIITGLPGLRLAGMMSHFPLADVPGAETRCREQWQLLQAGGAVCLPPAGVARPLLHMANSAALLRFPWAHGDLVRPGISLYGYSPLPVELAAAGLALQPAMSLRSRVLQVKMLPAGYGISYGHRYVTPAPTRLAVLPVGYADGYPRGVSGRAQVLLGGRRVPILGTICMNACMADVSALPAVQAGDEAVFLGRQGEEFIGADELADWHGTISYELLCRIGAMNQRLYTPLS